MTNEDNYSPGISKADRAWINTAINAAVAISAAKMAELRKRRKAAAAINAAARRKPRKLVRE